MLEHCGFEVRLGHAALARRAYLAGTDAERLRDLQQMIDARDVHAVFCARGGYGSQRVIPHLDLSALRTAPKAVVGYSDATALLAAIGRADVLSVHGPMVATDLARGLTARSLTHLQRLLGDPDYAWEIDVPVRLRPGRAEGPLRGGCLSVLATLLGTPHAPDFDGAIVFLEDVHEWPYRLDRLLTQLRQAGMFDRVAGVVFGAMGGCSPLDDVGPLEVARECFADAAFPVGFGLAAGHDPAERDVENLALPLGIRVVLDTDTGTLRALEAAVV